MKNIMFSICLALMPVVAVGQQAAKPPASTAIPIEILKSKHIAVQIKVNGKGPYRVIFDTGSPVTLLSNKVAKEADLLGKDAPKVALFGARGQATAKTFEIGDLKVENMPIMVMDHPALSAAARVLGPLEGIVGFPFFSRYKATFDYQASTITFLPVEYKAQSADLMEIMMAMMTDPKPKPPLKVQSHSTLFGFTVIKDKDDSEDGVMVKDILKGSAAEAAGLKAGDRLLEIDGTWTLSIEDCFRAAAGIEPGQKAKLKIKRDAKEQEVLLAPRVGL